MTKTNKKTVRLVLMALLSAIIIMLTCLPLRTMGFEITLAVIPIAVGAVVLNRVESSRHPNTIREVLLARGQFPPATNGTLTKKLTSGKISETSYAAASAALSGQDNTYGCLYFNRWNGRRQCLVYGKMGFW